MARINRTGRLSMLRVQRLGTGYGPPDDRIDVEVVIQLDTAPDLAFGFQLRNNDQGPALRGMLDLLRDAYAADDPVTIVYDIEDNRKHGLIVRVIRS
jgi:hypothetical protein